MVHLKQYVFFMKHLLVKIKCNYNKSLFPMHRIYAELQNSNIIKISYNKNLKLNINKLLDTIDEYTRCLCLANPNSPIGDSLIK